MVGIGADVALSPILNIIRLTEIFIRPSQNLYIFGFACNQKSKGPDKHFKFLGDKFIWHKFVASSNLNACSYLKDTKLSFLAMAVPVRLIVYGMMVFQEVTSYHLS